MVGLALNGRLAGPRRRRVALAGVAIACAAWWPVAGVLGASPSPEPAPAAGTVEAWLDSAFVSPPDLPPDGTILVGLTFWDTERQELVPLDGVFARLKPAKGKAAPTVADARADWPGHAILHLQPPRGGPGAITFGVHGSDGDHRLRLAGTGPPPDAPRAALVGAQILPVVGDVVAGRSFPIAVNVIPRGLWDYSDLELPEQIVVSAAPTGGTEVANAVLTRESGVGTPYTGRMTIPETGGVNLTMAFAAQSGLDEEIAASVTPLTVIEPGRRASPVVGAAEPGGAEPGTPGSEAAAGESFPLAWIVVIALLAFGLLLAFGGPLFRRLSRDR